MINFYLHTWIAVRGLISRRRLKHYSLRRGSVFSNGWPCTFMTLDENFFLKTTSMTAYTPTRVHFGPGGVCWFFIRFMGVVGGGVEAEGDEHAVFQFRVSKFNSWPNFGPVLYRVQRHCASVVQRPCRGLGGWHLGWNNKELWQPIVKACIP